MQWLSVNSEWPGRFDWLNTETLVLVLAFTKKSNSWICTRTLLVKGIWIKIKEKQHSWPASTNLHSVKGTWTSSDVRSQCAQGPWWRSLFITFCIVINMVFEAETSNSPDYFTISLILACITSYSLSAIKPQSCRQRCNNCFELLSFFFSSWITTSWCFYYDYALKSQIRWTVLITCVDWLTSCFDVNIKFNLR